MVIPGVAARARGQQPGRDIAQSAGFTTGRSTDAYAGGNRDRARLTFQPRAPRHPRVYLDGTGGPQQEQDSDPVSLSGFLVGSTPGADPGGDAPPDPMREPNRLPGFPVGTAPGAYPGATTPSPVRIPQEIYMFENIGYSNWRKG